MARCNRSGTQIRMFMPELRFLLCPECGSSFRASQEERAAGVATFPVHEGSAAEYAARRAAADQAERDRMTAAYAKIGEIRLGDLVLEIRRNAGQGIVVVGPQFSRQGHRRDVQTYWGVFSGGKFKIWHNVAPVRGFASMIEDALRQARYAEA